MATYYVWSGASGTNAGTSWTNAYTSIDSAVTAVGTTDGHTVLIHRGHQQSFSGAAKLIIWSGSVRILVVDKDNSDALATMEGYGYLQGNGETISFQAAANKTLYVYGLKLELISAGSTRRVGVAGRDGSQSCYEDCAFTITGTTSSHGISVGSYTTDDQVWVKCINCTFTFAHVDQDLYTYGSVTLERCTTAGSAITSGLVNFSVTDPGGALFQAVGCDFSSIGSGAPILQASTTVVGRVILDRCVLWTSYTLLASPTHNTLAAGEVFVLDCATGDTHGLYAYGNALGTIVSDTGLYYTSGAAAQSWKITTTAYASESVPFVSPWVSYYNTATSAITPYFEILRDGSSTAYTDAEVWAEFAAKTTSGSVLASFGNDKGTGSNQAAGAGTGNWTGESGTAWSGKCDSGASLTPAEAGDISGRLVITAPSIVVYLDPEIRT